MNLLLFFVKLMHVKEYRKIYFANLCFFTLIYMWPWNICGNSFDACHPIVFSIPTNKHTNFKSNTYYTVFIVAYLLVSVRMWAIIRLLRTTFQI